MLRAARDGSSSGRWPAGVMSTPARGHGCFGRACWSGVGHLSVTPRRRGTRRRRARSHRWSPGTSRDSRATTALPDGLGVGDRPAQRGRPSQASSNWCAARDRLHRHGAQRPGGDEVDPDALGAELAGQVAARSTPAPPWPRPSSRRPARRRWRRRSARRPRTVSPNSGRQAWVSEASDQEDTWNAVAACSHATSGKPSPMASCGAKPIECTTPSSVAPSTALLAQPVGQRGQVLGVGDVELDDRRLLRQPLGDPLAQRQRPPEVGQDDGGALLLRDARRREGDRRLGQHAGDQDRLALEDAHAQCPIPSPPSTGTTAPVM